MNQSIIIFNPLFAYIEIKSSMQLSDGDKELIKSAFKIKHLRKRQYLLQEGDVCKYMAFIVKGAGRMFSVNENGQEMLFALLLKPGGWVIMKAII